MLVTLNHLLKKQKKYVEYHNDIKNNRLFYQQFDNVTNSTDDILLQEFDQSLIDIENFDEFSNFCETSEEEGDVDKFKAPKKKGYTNLKIHFFQFKTKN